MGPSNSVSVDASPTGAEDVPVMLFVMGRDLTMDISSFQITMLSEQTKGHNP